MTGIDYCGILRFTISKIYILVNYIKVLKYLFGGKSI